MTLAIVIIVGLLGTLLFGWLAYRHWVPYVPKIKEPTQTTVTAQPVPLPVPVAGQRDHRGWFLWPVVVLLLVAIGIGTYLYFPWSAGTGSGPRGSYSGLPFDVVGLYLSGCESGNGTPGSGRQFNPDGSVVTNKNKNDTIDRGKWQINSSHDAEAKRRGIDLTTEEGNRQFAVILYERNDLLDWEATRHCWEPLIAKALGHSPDFSPSPSTPTADTTFVVTVRPGQPVEVVMPPDWMIVWWGDKAKFKSHAVWRGKDKVRVFTTRGMGSAEIKIHRYHDPDPNWWRRQ